ncbi:MAG TPA: IS6 family transposase [Steroidobacteraceae bacterium]|nr:IS6 family transposase [Steroidobacteraceae bacterium]
MTQPIERDAIYRRRRFPREVIKGCVRWYLTYRLSYRDLVELMAEWGVHVSHTTIMRWVHRYVPEYEQRWNRRAKPVGSSWRMDETYMQTRPKVGYLYRAVDKQGNTVESLFQTTRGIAAAMAFFRKAVVTCAPRFPRKITLDGHKQSRWGLRRPRREDRRWMNVLVRNSQYLNNIVEQDHRAIKGRCRPMLGFKFYRTAAVTLAGIELAHRIRKRQFKFGPGRWICWSLKKQGDRALA